MHAPLISLSLCLLLSLQCFAFPKYNGLAGRDLATGPVPTPQGSITPLWQNTSASTPLLSTSPSAVIFSGTGQLSGITSGLMEAVPTFSTTLLSTPVVPPQDISWTMVVPSTSSSVISVGSISSTTSNTSFTTSNIPPLGFPLVSTSSVSASTSAPAGPFTTTAFSSVREDSSPSQALPPSTTNGEFSARPVTSTVSSPTPTTTWTVIPPGFAVHTVTNTLWTSNFLLTTTVNNQPTVVPVFVNCGDYCGDRGSLILWGVPILPFISFHIPGFKIPDFHFPCIFNCHTAPPGGGGGGSPPPGPPPEAGPPEQEPEDNSKTSTDDKPTHTSTATSTDASITTSLSSTSSLTSSSSLSSSSSSSAIEQLCSPECSICDAGPTALPTVRRSENLHPRTMTNPDPEGALATYIVHKVNTATFQVVHGKGGQWGGYSTANSTELLNEPLSMSIKGLYGCTSVVIMSERRVYMSHFWEGPSFHSFPEFQRDVLNLLAQGGTDMPGIQPHIGYLGDFGVGFDPVIVIFTPKRCDSRSPFYDPAYAQLVQHLSNSLTAIVGVVPTMIDYVRSTFEMQLEFTMNGRLLFQYDPEEKVVGTGCDAIRTARARLWVEGVNKVDFTWGTHKDQVPSHNANQKRQDPACSLPASSQSTVAKSPSAIVPALTSALTVESSSGAPPVTSSNSPAGTITSSVAPLASLSSAVPSLITSTITFAATSATEESVTSSAPGTIVAPPFTTAPPHLPTLTVEACMTSSLINCKWIFFQAGAGHCPTTTELAPTSCIEARPAPITTTQVPAPSSPAPPPPPPYATGTCSVHVLQELDTASPRYKESVLLTVKITDTHGTEIGKGYGGIAFKESIKIGSKLSNDLILTPQLPKSKRDARGSSEHSRVWGRIVPVPFPVTSTPTAPIGLWEKGSLSFQIGGDSWDTSSDRCSVGAYDNGNFGDFFNSIITGKKPPLPNRQMDCPFAC